MTGPHVAETGCGEMDCKHRCGRVSGLTFRSSNCLPAFISPQPSTLCLNKSEETYGRCLTGLLLTTLRSDICLLSLFATRSMRTHPSRLFPWSLVWSEWNRHQNPHCTSFKKIRLVCKLCMVMDPLQL